MTRLYFICLGEPGPPSLGIPGERGFPGSPGIQGSIGKPWIIFIIYFYVINVKYKIIIL